MELKESRFAGFLDGYAARNIATLEKSLNVDIQEMYERIHRLAGNTPADQQHQEVIQVLEKLETLLKDRGQNIIDRLYDFGELLKSYQKELSEISDSKQKEMLKKVIYHFLNVAEKSADKKLSDMAIDIGCSFKDVLK